MKDTFNHTKWLSKPPTHCQLCNDILEDYFVDGKITRGPWAVMCVTCHYNSGVGLGLGKGQKYNLKTLEKVEG